MRLRPIAICLVLATKPKFVEQVIVSASSGTVNVLLLRQLFPRKSETGVHWDVTGKSRVSSYRRHQLANWKHGSTCSSSLAIWTVPWCANLRNHMCWDRGWLYLHLNLFNFSVSFKTNNSTYFDFPVTPSDNVNNTRTLSVPTFLTGPVTLEACTSACFKAGFRFSGAEYSSYVFLFAKSRRAAWSCLIQKQRMLLWIHYRSYRCTSLVVRLQHVLRRK